MPTDNRGGACFTYTQENAKQADRLTRQEGELTELRASMRTQAEEIAELRASVEALTTALKQ